MRSGRALHTATLLESGKVLVAGGVYEGYLDTSDIYDPGSGTFTPTRIMARARSDHGAARLSNGRVLVAGGMNGLTISSAELYDPASESFLPTGSMLYERTQLVVTVLQTGEVLVTGGFANFVGFIREAEVYQPDTGSFSATGFMNDPRAQHTVTVLSSGQALVIGGRNQTRDATGQYLTNVLSTAEIFDPSSGQFTYTGSLSAGRYGHTATQLDNGLVLVAGGCSVDGYPSSAMASAELYDPSTGLFTAAGSLTVARCRHTATKLHDGRVLLAGGWTNIGDGYLASAEVYDPAINTFSAAGTMQEERVAHTATLLSDGRVLVLGGDGLTPSSTATADIWTRSPP
jgi:hypothetical protein